MGTYLQTFSVPLTVRAGLVTKDLDQCLVPDAVDDYLTCQKDLGESLWPEHPG
jgi:hypothetical protein